MSSLELQSARLSLYQIDKMQKIAIPASGSLARPWRRLGLLGCSAWLWAGTSPGGMVLPAWLGLRLGAPVFFVGLPRVCFPLGEQWSTRPSSDQRWSVPALRGLVLLLPRCRGWVLSGGVLSGSLTFLRMTSSLTKFSHWEPEEKLEPSHCSTVCIMERPRGCFVGCFLDIFSWIPVLDALLDRMT